MQPKAHELKVDLITAYFKRTQKIRNKSPREEKQNRGFKSRNVIWELQECLLPGMLLHEEMTKRNKVISCLDSQINNVLVLLMSSLFTYWFN